MSLNITQHSDNELSDQFLNDEHLYGIAITSDTFDILQEEAELFFTFTPEQLATLKHDFNDGVFTQ